MWSNGMFHSISEAANHPLSGAAHYDLGRKYYGLAISGVEWAGEKAKVILEVGSQNDKHAITPDLLLVVLAGRGFIEYDAAWLKQAAEKLSQFPYIASSKSALKGLKNCIHDEACDLPRQDVADLFEVAFSQQDTHLLTTAAVYFGDVEKDYEKAEEAFRRAWDRNKRSPILWFNYIRVLNVLGKKERACEILEDFNNRNFKRLFLYEEDISEINEKLSECVPGVS